jgi:hypothetical protein
MTFLSCAFLSVAMAINVGLATGNTYWGVSAMMFGMLLANIATRGT